MDRQSGEAFWAGEATLNTTYVPYFNAIAVCAPVNVLVNDSTDGTYSISIKADAAASGALNIQHQGGSGIVGLSIETLGDFKTSEVIEVVLSLPPGQFNYAELDYTNSDLVINNTFNATKAEIANNGDGTVLIPRGLDTSLNKVSTTGAGDLLMRGNGSYSELFSAGSGKRYLSGLTGQINVKQDGTGIVAVNPGNGATSIAGVNTGLQALSYTQGNCTVGRDPDIGPAMVGDACTHVPSFTVPAYKIQWTCGIAVKGDFWCAGGGKSGPPNVTQIPCTAAEEELTMFTLDAETEGQ
ncbi:hypothetical protein WJX73_007783 [Symbiochloris irregularis]|uniref:Putative auto-transporter adhesin head GIN domain-containing protein n=1 Tax=Symbiochloris irregularis TaxID=706552 RepID=A0AAW1PHZ0_9CHLO